MKSFVGSILFITSALYSYSYAQTVLPEVSVKDSAAYRRALLSATSPLQIFSSDEITTLGLQDVAEALRLANGVTVKDYGGLGGMKTVSIRNLGAEHTGVIYDGVPVSNCQAGQIDISRFSADNIESIRMGIGAPMEMLTPASMEPFSGTLNIGSKRTAAKSWAKATYGSFNTINTSANIGYKRMNAFANYSHTDGDYPFVLTNGNLKTKERRNNGRVDAINGEINYSTNSFDAKAYYYYSDRGLPGGIILYNNSAHERLWDENSFYQTRYHKTWKQWDVQVLAKYNHSWNKYYDGNQIDDGGITMHTYRYRQDETYVSIGTSYNVAKTKDRLQLAWVTDETWNALRTNIPEFTHKYRTTTQSALRARYHDSKITANTSIVYTYLNEKINRKSLTPNASVSFRPLSEEDLFIRASWRKAFRLPTFNDMYYYRLGNHDLRPERTNELNIGITYATELLGGNLAITADAYTNRVHDLIVAIPTTFAWKMYNYGKVDIKGLNMAIDYSWKSLFINVGYNLNDACNTTDKESSSYGKQIPYTAKHSGNASIIWNNQWVNIGYALQWMGERYSSIMHEKNYRLKRFDDHSITLSHIFPIGKNKLDLSVMYKNIFDRQYDIIKFYPMPGRQFLVSGRLYFEKNNK